MNKSEALSKMVAPGTPRRGKYREGVIQIWLTRSCDKSCYGCTQGSNLAAKRSYITLENFEAAVITLKDYFGVVGIFGGNPALHPKFVEVCDILRKHIPFEQRGLWCNNPLGHGKVMSQTFNPGVSNLNVHLDGDAYNEFLRDWPTSRPFGLFQDSRHSPPYVAMKDVIDDESKRWELISNCDINQHWSAMICQVRGELKAYFCEIAGAQAMLHKDDESWPDLGLPVSKGWWRKPMVDFEKQVEWHCHRCGVPLRGYGELAQSQDPQSKEQVSATHKGVYKVKSKGRVVELVENIEQLGEHKLNRFTNYLQNAKV